MSTGRFITLYFLHLLFKFPIIKSNKTQGDRRIYSDSKSHLQLPSSGEEWRPTSGPSPEHSGRHAACPFTACSSWHAVGMEEGWVHEHASQHRGEGNREHNPRRQEGLLALNPVFPGCPEEGSSLLCCEASWFTLLPGWARGNWPGSHTVPRISWQIPAPHSGNQAGEFKLAGGQGKCHKPLTLPHTWPVNSRRK